jgi:uncharacterized protein YqeY
MSDLLKPRIQEDMKAAMRAQDKQRLGTIRLLMAAIKQREIDDRITLDDAGVVKVIEKMIKQRQDSIAQYEAGKRPDLVAIENQEIVVLKDYMPAQMSEAEIVAAVDAAVKTSGAASIKDIGKVMNELKSKLQGRADMSIVSAKVKQRLS